MPCDYDMIYSVNGQYASQGKLGVAVLGSHAKKEVIQMIDDSMW